MLNERQSQFQKNTQLVKENELKIRRWEEEITRLESELLKQVGVNEQTSQSTSHLKMARSEDANLLS